LLPLASDQPQATLSLSLPMANNQSKKKQKEEKKKRKFKNFKNSNFLIFFCKIRLFTLNGKKYFLIHFQVFQI